MAPYVQLLDDTAYFIDQPPALILSPLEVKEALTMLIAHELVLERKGKDVRTYYKINRQKLGEIISLLRQQSEKKGFALNPNE